MRIISGKYKGRYIPVKKNFLSRPTTDFAKENLFNVLSNSFDFEDLDVLDLFSGTGSISLEFSSRGAKRVVLVEKDFKTQQFIRDTVKELKVSNINIIKADAFKYIEKSTDKFDIVFADPPFDMENIADLPQLVLESELLKENGWFIFEHGKMHQFNDSQFLIDKRTYGSVNFSIFRKK